MTLTQPPSTPPRLPNQAASLVSPTPSVPRRSSPRLLARQAQETAALGRELFRMELKLKNAIRFTLDYYKKLEGELRNLHDEFGLLSKHHTLFDSTSREAYNLECPSSYYSFNSKTSRAHRQARRTNLHSRPTKRQRTR